MAQPDFSWTTGILEYLRQFTPAELKCEEPIPSSWDAPILALIEARRCGWTGLTEQESYHLAFWFSIFEARRLATLALRSRERHWLESAVIAVDIGAEYDFRDVLCTMAVVLDACERLGVSPDSITVATSPTFHRLWDGLRNRKPADRSIAVMGHELVDTDFGPTYRWIEA